MMSATQVSASDGGSFGDYFGRLLLEPLPDGRRMRLAEVFGFRDANQKRWPVPKDAIVDGASIPQALWSVMGGPFEGKYRDASVVHDYYCSTRLQSWRSVHRVFYEAMRASGVSPRRAKLMYAAVYFAGPRWSDMDTVNAGLPRIDEHGRAFSVHNSRFDRDVYEVVGLPGLSAARVLESGACGETHTGAAQLDMERLERLIEGHDPTLGEIDLALDQAVAILGRETGGHALVSPPTDTEP